MEELNGKVGIVSGAGRLRGIGRATAVALAHLGADVVVTGTGRDPSTLPPDEKAGGWLDVESTARQVRALGRRALPLVLDVTKPEQVEEMVARAVQELGRIDILINNAAYPRGADRVPTVDLESDCRPGVRHFSKGHGCESFGNLSLHPGRCQAPDQTGARRQDSECCLRSRQIGGLGCSGLYRSQLRSGRDDPVSSEGAWTVWYKRELRMPRLGRYVEDR